MSVLYEFSDRQEVVPGGGNSVQCCWSVLCKKPVGRKISAIFKSGTSQSTSRSRLDLQVPSRTGKTDSHKARKGFRSSAKMPVELRNYDLTRPGVVAGAGGSRCSRS